MISSKFIKIPFLSVLTFIILKPILIIHQALHKYEPPTDILCKFRDQSNRSVISNYIQTELRNSQRRRLLRKTCQDFKVRLRHPRATWSRNTWWIEHVVRGWLHNCTSKVDERDTTAFARVDTGIPGKGLFDPFHGFYQEYYNFVLCDFPSAGSDFLARFMLSLSGIQKIGENPKSREFRKGDKVRRFVAHMEFCLHTERQ